MLDLKFITLSDYISTHFKKIGITSDNCYIILKLFCFHHNMKYIQYTTMYVFN